MPGRHPRRVQGSTRSPAPAVPAAARSRRRGHQGRVRLVARSHCQPKRSQTGRSDHTVWARRVSPRFQAFGAGRARAVEMGRALAGWRFQVWHPVEHARRTEGGTGVATTSSTCTPLVVRSTGRCVRCCRPNSTCAPIGGGSAPSRCICGRWIRFASTADDTAAANSGASASSSGPESNLEAILDQSSCSYRSSRRRQK